MNFNLSINVVDALVQSATASKSFLKNFGRVSDTRIVPFYNEDESCVYAGYSMEDGKKKIIKIKINLSVEDDPH